MTNEMKSYHPIRPIRISNETWKLLKEKKQRGKSWDRTFKELLLKHKSYENIL